MINLSGNRARGYSIKCFNSTSNGFIQQVLGRDSKWYIASNEGDFKSLHEAREFFKNSTHELRGSDIWIEGPRGGRHSLFNRR